LIHRSYCPQSLGGRPVARGYSKGRLANLALLADMFFARAASWNSFQEIACQTYLPAQTAATA
jgi:hypothetical protein